MRDQPATSQPATSQPATSQPAAARAAGEQTLARLRAVVQSMHEGLVVADGAGDLVEWNPAALAMHGFAAPDDARRPLSEFGSLFELSTLGGEPVPLPDWPMSRVLRGETFAGRELVIRRTDTRVEKTFSYSGAPVRGPDGLVALAVLTQHDVNARRESEAALRDTEERFRTLFESIEDGFCIVRVLLDAAGDPVDYRIVEANPAFADATGLRGAVGRTVLEMVPDLERRSIESYARVAVTGEPVRFENYVAAWDRWFDVYAFRFGPPETRQVAIFFKNVTARKQAEARAAFLARLSQRLALVADPAEVDAVAAREVRQFLGTHRCYFLEVSTDGGRVTVLPDWRRDGPDLAGTYDLAGFGSPEWWRTAAREPFGIDDVRAHPWTSGLAASYEPIRVRSYALAPFVHEGRWVASVGVSSTEPRPWSADELALLENVVARAWPLVERARTARALRESEERFRQMANSIPQLAWTAKADGWIDWYNDRWYEYTGTRPADMEGWGWQSVHDPATLHGVLDRWRASIETGEPFDMEFPLRRADGALRPFLTRVAPVRGADGRVVQWFGTNTDVTDERRAVEERELLLAAERDARAAAENANRLRDEFLATLSHELRTPLNAIVGWANVLSAVKGEDPDLIEGIAAIDRNARVQAQLIQDLLDVSRIISGKLRLDVQRVELTPVVEAAIASVTPAARNKGIRLQKVLDPSAATVWGDPARLQQVVWNLLSNAIKFSPKDGRVQVAVSRVNSHVEIIVSDTGKGIGAEFLPYVFERFRQQDASTTRKHGGLGLGLAIVKHLVELHGGTVRADSDGEGTGATFTVHLPLTVMNRTFTPEDAVHPRTEGFDARPAKANDNGCPEPSLDGLRVLVVEDEPDARLLLRRFLEQCDAVVTAHGSVREALAAMAGGRFDVIVSDIGMPDQDGYDLIRQVRALPPDRGGRTPAVALTAFARSESGGGR